MANGSRVEDFIELERLYADRPAAYRKRVLGLVLLGYGYVAFCVLVIVGFVADVADGLLGRAFLRIGN